MTASNGVSTAQALYRGLFRWAWQHAGIPCPLQASHVNAALPGVQRLLSDPMTDVDASFAVRHLARLGFRQSAFHDDHALDRGIEALRLLNTRYHATMMGMRELREEHLKKKVKFRIGHVFKHKKFAYRGVIYGYDIRCERDAAWQAQMGVKNPNQPFYYVLPDASDSIRLFGGPRLTKYVAEDNVGDLDEKDVGKGISHSALVNYFDGFSERASGYKPNRRLCFEYAIDADDPDDTFSDMVQL